MRDLAPGGPADGSAAPVHVVMISEHASPLAAIGGTDTGGQNVYVAEVARHLARRGWRVDVLTRRDAAGLPDSVAWRDGVSVHHVPAGPPETIPKEDLLGHMPEFTTWTESFCRRVRPDLVHANFFMSGLVAADIRASLGIPFAVTFHALGRVRREHQGSADRFPAARLGIEERVAREAAVVIAECPQDRDDLERLYGVDPARIREVPCGVDPASFAPIARQTAREVLGLPADAFVALQLGRMVPRKGVDDALRGFARFRRHADMGARMLVVGGESEDTEGPELVRLKGIAREEDAAQAVRFTGRRDRDVLRYYYGAADVFVTVPWYEPFGITPLEAMASGLPVVGSGVGGIKHTVLDGETGILVPSHAPARVAEALGRLHADPGLRARMGAAGRKRVATHFTWDIVADALGAVFGEVARPSGVGPRPTGGFDELAGLLQRCGMVLAPEAEVMAGEIVRCILGGGKLLICGNGGSAADAQHMACELVGRFLVPGRRALPAIALGTDAAVVSAWSNDIGYDDALAREVRAFGKAGDAILGFSTSGRSANLLRAFEVAGEIGLRRLAILGRDGGPLLGLADRAIVVPSSSTPRIQEVHTLLLHEICTAVETDPRIAPAAPLRAKAVA